ncbi:MAG: transglutaminase-like domain-containing protein [Planctomycetota bacterium]|jgi:hypothetical protein
MTPTVLLLAAAALAAPPSGRPPTGPLERYEPRAYDATFEVTLSSTIQKYGSDIENYDLVDTPVVLPVILQGTWSQVRLDSLRAQLWLEGVEDPDTTRRARLDERLPHHVHLAVLTIPRFTGKSLRFRFGWRVQSWSSRIDDRAAAAIAWPRTWPEDVREGLQPQMYIESGDPMFRRTVERVSEGQLRMVPPYLAAKDLVRYCVGEIRVTGDGIRREGLGVLRGLELKGAAATARSGMGGPHDLVCVCVAMLRAAGIPARPVIGMQEREDGPGSEFVTWAEFYLPDAGWVPFDPVALRGKGIRTRDVRDAWAEFGTMKDLNRRIPIAFGFMPPVEVESPGWPALWGWGPRPDKAPSTDQQIRLGMTSRGRGVEDPGSAQ